MLSQIDGLRGLCLAPQHYSCAHIVQCQELDCFAAAAGGSIGNAMHYLPELYGAILRVSLALAAYSTTVETMLLAHGTMSCKCCSFRLSLCSSALSLSQTSRLTLPNA